jgi:hypothetical protein
MAGGDDRNGRATGGNLPNLRQSDWRRRAALQATGRELPRDVLRGDEIHAAPAPAEGSELIHGEPRPLADSGFREGYATDGHPAPRRCHPEGRATECADVRKGLAVGAGPVAHRRSAARTQGVSAEAGRPVSRSISRRLLDWQCPGFRTSRRRAAGGQAIPTRHASASHAGAHTSSRGEPSRRAARGACSRLRARERIASSRGAPAAPGRPERRGAWGAPGAPHVLRPDRRRSRGS